MTTEAFCRAFRYARGKPFSVIRDVSRDLEPQGACGTFAWSVLHIETGGKPWKAILTGRAMLWRCWSDKNRQLPRHAVLWVRGKGWIDSTDRFWRDSPKPHKRAWPVGFPVLAVLALLWASPLRAETVHSWGSQFYGSTISLEPTTAPGAVAQVAFQNATVHADELVTFTLDLDGLSVTVEALVGRGLTPDRMTVSPPAGFIAVPPEIDVPENEVGVVLIMPWLGY